MKTSIVQRAWQHREPRYTNNGRAGAQAGVVLVVSLIMLLIMTILGVSLARTTAFQERMSANLQERQLAFQSSETALRAAELAIVESGSFAALGAIDCSDNSAAMCPPVPANTWTADSTDWRAVDDTFQSNELLLGTRAEFHVALIGTVSSSPTDPLGQSASANPAQYGEESTRGGGPTELVYRVTVRSRPANNADGALVVLQSTFRVRN